MFVFDCCVSEKRTLYLYYIFTFTIKQALIVFDCYVSEKCSLYLYFIVMLVISARCVLVFDCYGW